MRAKIVSFNELLKNYQAVTQNHIAVAFSLAEPGELALNEEIDLDLPNLVNVKQIVRLKDNSVVKIKIQSDNLHDLTIPMRHGTRRTPSKERLEGK